MTDDLSATYEFLRTTLGSAVPFAAHTGVELAELTDGRATASLAETPNTLNHVGSQHAGALYTLAETASGAAMAGALADRILDVRPLVRTAKIDYTKVARGTITATATTSVPSAELRATLDAAGRAELGVEVVLRDAGGTTVATAGYDWVVIGRRGEAS